MDYLRVKKRSLDLTLEPASMKVLRMSLKIKGDAVKDPLFGGMMIQTAIGSVYQTMINDHKLHLFALKSNFDPIKIVEEECQRALNKYLE